MIKKTKILIKEGEKMHIYFSDFWNKFSRKETPLYKKFYFTFLTYFFSYKIIILPGCITSYGTSCTSKLKYPECLNLHCIPLFLSDRRLYTITQLKEQRTNKTIKDFAWHIERQNETDIYNSRITGSRNYSIKKSTGRFWGSEPRTI